ncbi:MAG: family 43 glycosylhydrolase, partial [Butyrivibrio sp.]|nr:family 43 glycosylhydrolase [Butyrivibrio sp.]
MKYLNSKKLLSVFLIAGMSVSMISGCGSSNKLTETEISKSPVSNPIVGNSSTGDFLYGGDPSVLVDGDTVYLYTGHDASSDAEVNKAIYNIPEYLCYSSKDLITWNYEGSVMNMKDVSWGDKTSAWASQVAKHTDPETGKDKYYLYFCSWDKTSNGRQSIGVAVSDSPTGPFVDIGEPLVSGNVTKTNSSNWEDIDPTVWIDTDDEGVEHRYLAWGNACFFICELNEDMISVKDITGNHEITYGTDPVYDDIINKQSNLGSYTEAPWLYRKSDGNGGYTGDYYLFYASGWREGMSYATTDDLIYGKWMFGDAFMTPNATSNTNHMAVFDFQGETYMVYHDGALPGGNGYRRSACIAKLEFEDDGSVKMFEESTAAIGGTVSTIQTLNDEPISHVSFNNPASDTLYPFKGIV